MIARMMKLFLVSFVFFNASLKVQAQDTTKSFKFAVSFNESLSHTGINSGITFNIRYKNHEVYVGPEMALSDSYFRDDPRMGYTGGVRYYTSNAEKHNSFVFIDFHRIFYRPYLQKLYNSNKMNTISEVVVGMGQEWKLYKHWYLSGSMAYGKYFDVYHDLPEKKVAYFDDGTILLRFGATYKF